LNHRFGTLVAAALILVVLRAAAETSPAFQFASVDQARALLTTRDEFVTRLSPFDRAARLKTDRDVSEREYLEFVGASVRPWEDGAEKDRVTRAFGLVRDRFEEMSIQWPDGVLMIRTTGQEEGGAAYTRGKAIVLPDNLLADRSRDRMMHLISHELFHILSRRDASLRASLYKIIGFEPCPEFSFPQALAPRKITNPDAPRNDHRIRVRYRDEYVWAVPIIFSGVDKYNTAKGGEFFKYLQFRLALASTAGNGSEPSLVEPGEVEEFFEQIGTNTNYIIHPEEILAENFALLITGRSTMPSPAIPAAILQVLKSAR
jgi:hypothetical protein